MPKVFKIDKDHFLPITSPIPLALQIFDSISDISNLHTPLLI
ncbi:MAG TPA: hypothetical protein VJ697_09450 [Nitrososphaeraceae archaeon]|nr:hypothetical protein [Nitrososphaeraceae archaeon]